MALFLHKIIQQSVSHIKTYSFRISGSALSKSTSIFKQNTTAKSPLLEQLTKNFCNQPYDVCTKVAKDTILYKYDHPRFFRMLNLCAILQFMFWNYLSFLALTTLRDAPIEKVPEDAPWYRKINLGDNKYRNGITVSCFLIGYGVLAVAWMYTLRSVRFLVLRKGGEALSFVTYGPFGHNRIITIPLRDCSAMESRQTAKVQLPIKIKNKSFYYILDMRGEFKNARLFDFTAGLGRKLQMNK